MEPGAHNPQLVALFTVENVPPGQGTHESMPATLANDPGAHGKHTVWFAEE